MPPALRPRGPKPEKIEPSALLDAAQAVFAAHGVEGASVRAIARAAGCDPALLYYHFDHKEAMFQALLDRKFSVLLPDLEAAVAGPAALKERLANTLQVLGRHLREDAGFRALIRGQAVQGAEPIKTALATFIRRLQGLIWNLLAEGVASGELRKDLPVPLAGFFLVRTYLEMLDLFPAMGPHFLPIPVPEALDLGERAWLDFFWRGAAASEELP